MERKLWHEQQTQKCALTASGLLIEGLRYCPNLNDALRRVKGGSELVALSIGQRLYASGCLGS